MNKKNLRLISIGLILLAFVLLATQTTSHGRKSVGSRCGVYRTDKTLRIGSSKIQTEIAKTTSETQQGLGGRGCIEYNRGMLFAFDKPGQYSFWMKDMRFPIDIIWIGADHKVAALETNVQPSTYPDKFVNKDSPAQFVLELQAGRANSLGLLLGTPVNF